MDVNLNLLEKISPGCRKFLEVGSKKDTQSVEAKSSHPSLRYQGRLIHSAFDPVQEAWRMVEQSGVSPGDHILVYGFGLGYHVEAILTRIGHAGRLVVVEFNPDIMVAACSLRDLKSIFSDGRFSILLSAEMSTTLKELDLLLKAIGEKGGKLILHPPSLAAIPQAYAGVSNAFELFQMEKRTVSRFVSHEEKNFLRNRPLLFESRGVRELYGNYSGRMGFMISAGPSLDLSLPYLALLKGRGGVFSTDAAFQVLVDAGIVPEFVISIDPQPQSLGHFLGYFDQPSTLIFSPFTHPEVVGKFQGERITFVSPSQRDFLKDDYEALSAKGETNEGGSVACVGLDLMARFGFNPIVLLGQDCSFPFNRFYASNNGFGKQWDNKNMGATLDEFHLESIRRQEVMWTEDRFGGRVPAHQNLYSYRGYIEEIVAANKQLRFINFHSMGLSIDRMDDIFSLAEICGQ